MITVVQVSDLHFGRGRDDATKTGGAVLKRIHDKYKFASAPNTCLLALGDFVDGEDPLAIDQQWKDALEAFTPFKDKLLVCAGNHDQAILTGELHAYGRFCRVLGVSGACSVAETLTDGQVTVDTLGLDSTWWSPVLGITGIGKIDDSEFNAAKAFANKTSTAWKLLYLHHRPIELSVDAELKLLAAKVLGEKQKESLRKMFLALRGANRLCKAISQKIDFMCFGHDKRFATDFGGSQRPYWINSNREDNTQVGWVELSFEATTCDVKHFSPEGTQLQQTKISKK